MEEKETRRILETYADMILRISYSYLRQTYDAETASSNLVASTQNLSGFEKFSNPLFYLSSNFFLTFIIYQYFYGGWILRPEKPDDQNAEVRLSLTLPPTSGCIYLKTASLCVTVQYSTIVHVRTEMKLRFFKNHTRRTRK